MKKLLSITMVLGLMIMPVIVYAESEQAATVDTQPERMAAKAPSIPQSLVPEGAFALRLAVALNLGTPETEAQAEDMLASVAVSPKNGWIADYPMTPIIIGQVRDDVVAAAALKKLPMGKDEALQAFDGLTAELGLSIGPAPGQSEESPPPTDSEYIPPPEIEDYYYEEGPPVVTYYPPPWDYYYLYAWVPYPFFCTGFFFPGFFILNDFHHFHHGRHLISNHFSDPKTHASLRVDPTTKTTGITATRAAGFSSPEANRGAASIFNRGVERARLAGLPGTAGKRVGGAVPHTGGRSFFGIFRGKGSGGSGGGLFRSSRGSGGSGGSRGGGHGGSHGGGHR